MSVSIFNDVIGPVMRGPSSSHTAGAFRIEAMARSLLGGEFRQAWFSFDPEGSYGNVYHQQGADLAFAAGLLGWSITDERYHRALDEADRAGRQIEFTVEPNPDADHPNSVAIDLLSMDESRLRLSAKSTDGGAVEITSLNDWPVLMGGRFHEIAVEMEGGSRGEVDSLLAHDGELHDEIEETSATGGADEEITFISAKRLSPLPPDTLTRLENHEGVKEIWTCVPVFLVERGNQLWRSAREMVERAGEKGTSLGRLALEFESVLLGFGEDEILEEMGSGSEETSLALLAAGAIGVIIAQRATFISALNTDGCPIPFLITEQALSRNSSGFLSLSWMFELGWTSFISSITSRRRKETSLTTSPPSAVSPPTLIFAKSV